MQNPHTQTPRIEGKASLPQALDVASSYTCAKRSAQENRGKGKKQSVDQQTKKLMSLVSLPTHLPWPNKRRNFTVSKRPRTHTHTHKQIAQKNLRCNKTKQLGRKPLPPPSPRAPLPPFSKKNPETRRY